VSAQRGEFFDEDSDIVQHLDALLDVGLRLYLARPVAHRVVGRRRNASSWRQSYAAQLGDTLYLLDESRPRVTQPLIVSSGTSNASSTGNTVIVVEHDMRVVAEADWVIDLGPGAGRRWRTGGGRGDTGEVSVSTASRTAPFLKAALVSRQY
jgi:excinuclease ABC subunit A